ncbi:MAG: HdeA/HdeB family chaperone [Xanthobacteraceae bacterium]
MRLSVMGITVATLILPVAANTQITIQMANIRCDQYLAMPPSDSERFSAWMSGWFSYQTRTPWVDLLAYRQNIANVKAWCQKYPNEKVMSGLKQATGTK